MSTPTAVGLAALAPQPMTAEQVADLADLVTRVRSTQSEAGMSNSSKRWLKRDRALQAKRDRERIEYTRRVLDQMAAEARQ